MTEERKREIAQSCETNIDNMVACHNMQGCCFFEFTDTNKRCSACAPIRTSELDVLKQTLTALGAPPTWLSRTFANVNICPSLLDDKSVFEGVECDNNGAIVEAVFPGSPLNGYLSDVCAFIQVATSLKRFVISYTNVTGAVPQCFSAAPSLTALDVSHNRLRFTVPRISKLNVRGGVCKFTQDATDANCFDNCASLRATYPLCSSMEDDNICGSMNPCDKTGIDPNKPEASLSPGVPIFQQTPAPTFFNPPTRAPSSTGPNNPPSGNPLPPGGFVQNPADSPAFVQPPPNPVFANQPSSPSVRTPSGSSPNSPSGSTPGSPSLQNQPVGSPAKPGSVTDGSNTTTPPAGGLAGGYIALIIILVLICLAVIAVVIFLLWRKNRQQNIQNSPKPRRNSMRTSARTSHRNPRTSTRPTSAGGNYGNTTAIPKQYGNTSTINPQYGKTGQSAGSLPKSGMSAGALPKSGMSAGMVPANPGGAYGSTANLKGGTYGSTVPIGGNNYGNVAMTVGGNNYGNVDTAGTNYLAVPRGQAGGTRGW